VRARRALRRRLPAAVLGLLAACAAPPDLVFHGGRVLTLDHDPARGADPADGRDPSAVAVRDGRVVAVGGEELLESAGPDTRIVDLRGRVLMPAFADAHLHPFGLGAALSGLDLVGTRDFDAVLARVAARDASLPSGRWLVGRGWDQNDWPDTAFPTRDRLDALVPDRPVLLVRVDGHAALANGAALRAAGVDAGTPDPEGGRILRDAAGEPTGLLVDAAVGLVRAAMPPPDEAELEERLRRAQDHLLARGVVAVHAAGLGAREIAVLRRWDAEGRLRLRVHVMLDGDDDELLAHWFARGPELDHLGRGHLAVRAVKLYADGALGSRGAWLLDDYADDPGNRGLVLTPPERIREVAVRCREAGFQVCTHAIGDAANRAVLDAYAAAGVRAADRFRIEHAQVVAEPDFRRFAELGVLPSMQAQHEVSDAPWAEDRLGPDRARGAYAWRRFLDLGVPVPGGSDAPVERVDPFAAWWAACARQDLQLRPPGGWHSELAMSRDEALLHLTVWPAHAAFREADLGRIAPGYRADFVVVAGGDPRRVAPEGVRELRVLETWVDGELVSAPDLGSAARPPR